MSPTLLVVEPHPDDAVLSAGGSLLLERDRKHITILTVHSTSNYTKRLGQEDDFVSEERVTAVRAAESRRAADRLGAELEALGEVDWLLRTTRPTDWTRSSTRRLCERLDARAKFPVDATEIEILSQQLQAMIEKIRPYEIWAPLGVGDHVDHHRTRSAILAALPRLSRSANDVSLWLWEDVPYSIRAPSHAAHLIDAYRRSGFDLERRSVDIGDVFETKCELAAIYESQFDPEYINQRLRVTASTGAERSGRLTEIAYRVRFPPDSDVVRAPSPWELSPNAVDLAALRLRLAPWLQRSSRIERLAVFATCPFGDWPQGMTVLLERFPNARIDVFISEDDLEETRAWTHQRIRVHGVPVRPRATAPGSGTWEFLDRSLDAPWIDVYQSHARGDHALIVRRTAFNPEEHVRNVALEHSPEGGERIVTRSIGDLAMALTGARAAGGRFDSLGRPRD
jgi:LmbE family N-acetylglucosaminyl deacetylase